MNKREILILSVMGGAVLFVFAGIYLISKKQVIAPDAPQTTTQEEAAPPEPQKTVTGLAIPEVVHAFNGTVIETFENYFTIKALSHNNFLPEDMEMKVYVDGDTVIRQNIIPKVMRGDEQVDIQEVDVDFTAIKTSETVQVYAMENIRGRSSFVADNIKIFSVKEE